MTLEAVHTAVPGRARFKVEGLYRSKLLSRLLEERLPRARGIERVSANPLTGNVLVRFDPALGHEAIAAILEDTLAGCRAAMNQDGGWMNSAPSHELLRRRHGRPPASAQSECASERGVAEAENAAGAQQDSSAWHVLDTSSVLARCETSARFGLSQADADERLKAVGPNRLPETAERSAMEILLSQVNSMPVALLTAAAALSLATGGIADALAIMGVVAINAAIGYVTESRSETAIRSLRNLMHPIASVVRDGTMIELHAERVVPGDILVLKPGSYVCADARLLEARRLTVDESALTGESMPVSKVAERLDDAGIPLADRVNMVYRGTLVTGGQGLAVVVATGRATELGLIQTLAAEAETPMTPMARELERMGRQLVAVSCAVCGLVFGIGMMRGFGLLEMLKSSISLAVAAVPEGLPTIATTTLALGVMNMRRRRVLVRRLDAVETLGCIQTICLDKTGTLTLNRMAVVGAHAGMRSFRVADGRFFEGEDAIDPSSLRETAELLRACVLCSDTVIERESGQYRLKGSPTENALVQTAIGAGVDVLAMRRRFPTTGVIRRSEDRNFMCTLHADAANPATDTPVIAFVKGSPGEVLAMCRWQLRAGETVALTDDDRLAIETENARMAGRALRVLGCACRKLDGAEITDPLDAGLIWLGLVAMADPVRTGVSDVIRAFHRAGIDTVMITGDQSATAYALGKELGLSRNGRLEILDSTELAKIAPAAVGAISGKVQIFARVNPANKLQVVRAFQSAGKVVAMTGDGINDGPALKAADVGIAMGTAGTDVAREVADVVLQDDNLETMLVAVRQGRTIYRNIRKSVHFLLSTNLSEIAVMLVALGAGMGQPLNAMQLLWINLVTDVFPGLALAVEQPEADVMTEPPRSESQPIVQVSDFPAIAAESGVISASALAAYGYGLARYGAGARAATLAFTSLTAAQLLHTVSCRSETHTIFDPVPLAPNPYLLAALAGSIAVQSLTFMVPGLRSLLGITPIGAIDGLVIGAAAGLPLFVNEALKKWRARSAGELKLDIATPSAP
jgi:Ca2+-transporting ATPase